MVDAPTLAAPRVGVDLRCAMTPEQEAKIISLCERIGMPWEKVANRDTHEHPWNGVALNMAHRSTMVRGTSDLVHDVAHWLVATPDAREDPWFGLEYWIEEPAYEEEALASLLGILLERSLGLDWRYTWQFHSWDTGGWAGIRPVILSLRQRGLIRGLTPTFLLDATSTAPGR